MEKQNPTEEIKNLFRSELKEKFNETKFDEDVKSGKNISLNNLNEYKKEKKEVKIPKDKDDEDNQMSNNNGLCFSAKFKNGEYVAVGSNGHVIKSKDIDDLNRQMAQVFKLNAMKRGIEAECTFCVGENVKNKKKWKESFARNFINAGVVVKGDLPQSPEFWNKMKAEYLAKEGHSLEKWNKLTRFVPREYMQTQEKTSQYQTQKQKPSMATQMAKARTGR